MSEIVRFVSAVPRPMLLVSLLLLSVVCEAKPPPGASNVIEGPARVVDGDTLWIGKDKVRLYGIDAPEKSQSCTDEKGQTYSCGKASTDALQQIVGKNTLRCEVKDVDQYGRNVAACSLKPTTPSAQPYDINAHMVSNGHATAYRAITKTYVAYEDKAKLQKKGIWAGKFQKPSDWRKEAKAAEASAAAKATTAQHQRPQQPRPQPAQQLPLGPRPDQPAASSVGAGTGSKPSYAGVLGKH